MSFFTAQKAWNAVMNVYDIHVRDAGPDQNVFVLDLVCHQMLFSGTVGMFQEVRNFRRPDQS
jgi:hypothetical protein